MWKPVEGFEDRYLISDNGVVKSLRKNIYLKPQLDRGYPKVILSKNGKSYTKRIHRLVAEAFIGPCPPGMEVCHNDNNKLNNEVSNLRYDTHCSNINDMVISKIKLKSHCKNGHEWTKENTHVRPNGYRRCKACEGWKS